MSDISGKLSENKDLSATISPKGGTLSASLMSGRGVGHGIPAGGTTGQALVKASNDDYDAIWKSLESGDVAYSDSETYSSGTIGSEVSDLKSAINFFDDIPGTVQTVNFDANGNPSSIVHTANGEAVRTDSFTWGVNTVTEKRELADGSYITFVTDLTTLVTTISEIQEA